MQRIREYGLGVGGFYSPIFASGGQMHLKMFCLGQHWDAASHRYEETRSTFDGASPPPMPDFLVKLAAVSLMAWWHIDSILKCLKCLIVFI